MASHGCERQYIAVAPDSTANTYANDTATDFLEWAQPSYWLSQSIHQMLVYFESEAAVIQHVKSPLYTFDKSMKLISGAIIFTGTSNYQWSYKMRFNMSELPDTTHLDVDNSIRSNTAQTDDNRDPPFLDAYTWGGTFAVANVVNSWLASYSCRLTSMCTSSEDVMVEMAGSVKFPNPEVQLSEFWGALGGSFAILMILALLYPLSNMIKSLVAEKESKLREGMMMMSLRSDALWSAWILHFILLILPLSILLTLVGAYLFENSSSFLVFSYFFVFFLAAMSYAIFMSIFFSKARTASIIGGFVFFGGWFIVLGITGGGSGTDISRATCILAALHPAAAFTLATSSFVEYEDAAIGVTFYTWNVSEVYPVTFHDMINMLFVDFLYLLVLSWYFTQVWPTEYGTQKPWYFLFEAKYWYDSSNSSHNRVVSTINFDEVHDESVGQIEMVGGDENDAASPENNQYIEEVSAALRIQIENNNCVDIRNLYKRFETASGARVAVDQLSLQMFQGHITALLGHNGAGKTTTIAMLTGLLPPDSGSAKIEGLDLNENMAEIRKKLGVCPQHDILYDDLTVVEHLRMFANFKGLKREEVDDEVERMVQAVGLTEKRHVYSQRLSGGQKRKLSVAIAFIGGSPVVFLDEPTSGMDPYSRRFTWNIIRNHKEGRVIVLTTHFMDEADLLGDRIAIMGHGKLKCCGSSLFLKKVFGVGYSMTLEKKEAHNFNVSKVENLVKSHVHEAKLLSDAGKEISYQLPFNASHTFPKLFEAIDSRFSYLDIESYGISVTTLEEVFLRVSQLGVTHEVSSQKVGVDSPSGHVESDPVSGDNQPIEFKKLGDEQGVEFFNRHFVAMMTKRAFYFSRDTKSWVLQFVVPAVFVCLGLTIVMFNEIRPNQPAKLMTPLSYNEEVSSASVRLPFPYTEGTSFCSWTDCPNFGTVKDINYQEELMSKVSYANSAPMIGVSNSYSIQNMSYYLHNNRKNYEASTFGAVSIGMLDSDTNDTTYAMTSSTSAIRRFQYAIHANYTATHAGHVFNTLTAEAVLRSYRSDATLSMYLHPLPKTYQEEQRFDSFNQDVIVTFVMLAAPCIPAAFATFVVRERETRSKQQQLVSGVSIPAYWISTWLWDNLSYQPTVWMLIFLFAVFPDTDTIAGSSDALGCTIGLLILFGSATSGFAYLMSFVFKDAATAQIAVMFLCFVLGLILGIVGIVLRIIPSTRDVYMTSLRYVFALFPPFNLADGLHNLVLRQTWGFAELTPPAKYVPLSWDIAGLNVVFLAVESVVYLILTIFVDYGLNTPFLQEWFMKSSMTKQLELLDEKFADISEEDEDVLAERQRVISGNAHDDSVIMLNDVKKIYGSYGKEGFKYAVKGVSIGIPNGECFGLLGINGAGKSTTLSILSGAIPPSAGEAFVGGLSLSTNVHSCRGKIGFCPQFDALFELLTGREHLILYARIKGIYEEDIPKVVEGKIREMGLSDYADQVAGQYSGGNKRKLSVAIAMIGEPSIVFLDEPSTGMDPVARRFMWEVITDIVTKREKCSVILTTHSMEECEALCTRIGIMVGGRLKCLGPSQRLRSQYGHGYQIEINYANPTEENLREIFMSILRSSGIGTDHVNFNVEDGATIGTDDVNLTKAQVQATFRAAGKMDWDARALEGFEAQHGSGSEIYASLNNAEGVVSAKLLATWWFFEDSFDRTCDVFNNVFGEYKIREQQISKVRYEILSNNLNGTPRQISSLFALMEEHKAALHVQEYSISQTSLEQIFNQFAATQEEEGHHTAGNAITDGNGDADMSNDNNSNVRRHGYNRASSDDTAVEIQQAISV